MDSRDDLIWSSNIIPVTFTPMITMYSSMSAFTGNNHMILVINVPGIKRKQKQTQI